MGPGLWICLFACTAFPVQLTGLKPSKEAVVQNSVSDLQDLGKYAVEEAMEIVKNHLVRSCNSSQKERMRVRQTLENTLLEASISQENLIVAHEDVQTLIFRIKPQDFRGLNISSDMLPDGNNSSLLNDDILGATLGGVTISNLSQPVEIRFWHNFKPANNSSMTCVFWEEGKEEGSMGAWSPTDCKTIIQEGLIVCQCNHLTYFAVLLQISPPILDEGLLVSLTYITSIGCSLSAAACLLTACLYHCSRKKQQDFTTKIHMHLLEALFLLNTSFLVSELLVPVTTMWTCQVAAVFLHYSLLCGLTWMALEGFHLYMLMIRVYNLYIRYYLLKLCAVGWGLPGLAVMTVFLINKQAYGIHTIKTTAHHSNKTMCWITSIEVHYFNLIYLSITMLFNMSILTLVVRQLRRLRANSPQQKEHSYRGMVTVLGLTCILGTTWTLAFISFGVFSIPQLYLFTVLNSFQGLFICLWYCTLRCSSQASASERASHPSQ